MTRSATRSSVVSPDELAPVRAALLELAHRDAERTLADAEADAAAALDRAAAEVQRVRDAARAEAAEDVAQLLAREQGRRDRQARATQLRARGAAYDALVRRARQAARELARDPDVHARLVELARDALGADAAVRDDPDGGVVAELGGRRVAYSLPDLADEAVAALLSGREEGP